HTQTHTITLSLHNVAVSSPEMIGWVRHSQLTLLAGCTPTLAVIKCVCVWCVVSGVCVCVCLCCVWESEEERERECVCVCICVCVCVKEAWSSSLSIITHTHTHTLFSVDG